MGVGALLLESSNILKYWIFSTINLPRHHLSCNPLLLSEIRLNRHRPAAEAGILRHDVGSSPCSAEQNINHAKLRSVAEIIRITYVQLSDIDLIQDLSFLDNVHIVASVRGKRINQ